MNQKILIEPSKALLIKTEKRKRIQAYNTMDYSFNLSNFMDFYSKDLIKILSQAQILSNLVANDFKSFKKPYFNEISSEHILSSFILGDFNLKKMLSEYGLTPYVIQSLKDLAPLSRKHISTFSFFYKKMFYKAKYFFLKNIALKKIGHKQNESIFSSDALGVLQKSIVNAANRFKTPIISPEIFFITLMESKASKASKAIKNVLHNKLDWHMLRYELIKNVHIEESHIRDDVAKSQKYFGYLLKSRLSQLEFSRLIDLDLVGLAVEYFRNKLLKKALHADLLSLVKRDVFCSAYLNKRKYFHYKPNWEKK